MKKTENYVIIAFTAMFILLVCFFMSPGAGDMSIWERWMDYVSQYGIIDGYEMQHDMYPPFALLIQYMIKYICPSLSNFIVLRLTNTFFVILSLLLTYFLFKDLKIVVLVFACLFLNSNIGYLDGEMAPFLILAVYFFNKENFRLSGLFLTLLSLVKFQPLIVAPFLLLYFIDVYDSQQQKYKLSIKMKKLLQISLPVIVIWAVVCIIYKGEPIKMLRTALFSSGGSIAPNALNLGWIIQFVLEKFMPDTFGGLYEGSITIIWDAPKGYLSFKYIFIILYFITALLLTLHKEKSCQLVLRYAIIGYTVYFLFNSGVHENHLFLAALLMILLYVLEPTQTNYGRAVMYLFILNMNLIVFYGLTGVMPFIRIIGGLVDPTLVLAAFNVIYLSVTCFHMTRETVCGMDNFAGRYSNR